VGPPRQEERRAFESNVWKSCAYTFLMDLSLSAPIWVLYLRDERGFSLTQITLLEVPLFLLIVFAEIPTGAVADRFGRRVSLLLASAILALAMFIYGVATSYPVILISNLAWGLAYTFRSGADTALLYDSLKQAGREGDFQRINGRFWALRSSAMLAGLLLGAPIAAATSYTFAITLGAILHGCAFLVALWMHEPRHARQRAGEPYLRTLASGVRDAWRRPTLRYIFLYSGVVGAGAAGPLLLLQQPWLAERGVGTARLGLWQGPAHAAEVLSALAAARVLSRLGERGAFLALPVTLSVCGVALAWIDHAWIAVAFLGMALARGLHNPVLAGYVNRRIESERRATVLSVQSVVGNVAMAIAWPLAGVVADASELQGAFLMYASGTLALGGGALLLWNRAERADVGVSGATPAMASTRRAP
jgi:MFS family permease